MGQRLPGVRRKVVAMTLRESSMSQPSRGKGRRMTKGDKIVLAGHAQFVADDKGNVHFEWLPIEECE